MKEKNKPTEYPVEDRHTEKKVLEAPDGELTFQALLEALDREVAFYRRRAGQVFFLGLVFEILILAGREKESVLIPPDPNWLKPLIYSIFFVAVAVIGIALGREYRSRIRYLKDSRQELLAHAGYRYAYPTEKAQNLSEIQVLYVVLVFLSSIGMIIVWLNIF